MNLKTVKAAETPPCFISGALPVHLCELADRREAVGQLLGRGQAVSLHGVGGLWRTVARRQVRGRGSRQTSGVKQGLRLRSALTHLRSESNTFKTFRKTSALSTVSPDFEQKLQIRWISHRWRQSAPT